MTSMELKGRRVVFYGHGTRSMSKTDIKGDILRIVASKGFVDGSAKPSTIDRLRELGAALALFE